MNTALTMPETIRLDELEAVIDRGIKTFSEVGSALMAIRDAKLYRTEHGTFEDYCKERWGMGKAYAHRMIASAEVLRNLSPMGDIPASERQTRPLAKLPPSDQPKAWQAATERAESEGRKVTAKDVEIEVEIIKPKKQQEVQERTRPIGPPCDGMQFARIAIMNLEQIKNNDVERVRAFAVVKDWISKNEK